MKIGFVFPISTQEQPDVRSKVHIPMVYERVPEGPTPWEYNVLRIDTRERDLPETDEINTFGKDGWLLAGLIDERAAGRGNMVYFYFLRQADARDNTQSSK